MEDRTDSEDGFVFSDRHGRVELTRLGPRDILVRYRGGIGDEAVAPVQAELDAVIRKHGSLRLFVDAEEMASYTAEYRRRWTSWLMANRGALASVHILFRSRLVQMGINLVNPLIGGFLTSHSERTAFERAIDEARARPRQ